MKNLIHRVKNYNYITSPMLISTQSVVGKKVICSVVIRNLCTFFSALAAKRNH